MNHFLLALMAIRVTSLCFFLWFFSFGSEMAKAEGWVLDVHKRETERKQEKWYFSEHLEGKSASSRLDLMYRFFLGKRTPTPRIELVAYGLGLAIRQKSSLEAADRLGSGFGYGGRVAFNHFFTYLTGIPTLNMVPNAFAEITESSFQDGVETTSQNPFVSQSYGAGFRLFGQNPEDTSIYVDYSRRRLRFPVSRLSSSATSGSSSSVESTNTSGSLGEPGLYESFVVEASGQIYLFRYLAITAGGVFNEAFIPPHEISSAYRLSEIRGGGQIDAAMFRLSYEYLERVFTPKTEAESGGVSPAGQTHQIIHLVRLGFVL